MSPFSALKQFFSPQFTGAAPVDDPFVVIDVEGVRKSLKLEQRGSDRGGLCRSDDLDAGFDVVEHEIINLIGEELNQSQINARTQSQAYENRLSDLRLLHEVSTIRAETVKALGDFNSLVIDWRNTLTPRRDAIRKSYHDLRLFMVENKLQRPAHVKPPAVVTYGGLAFSALVEVVGNAFFLRVNDDLGYLGGLLAAIIVAGLNVGTAAAVGWHIMPMTQIRNNNNKILANIAIGIWLVAMVVWNLFAAHFRDAKALGIENAQGYALQTLKANPLGLDGLYSWGLFIIGMLMAALAAGTAYKHDDPFPGYGEKDRQHTQRCDEYAEAVGEAIRNLTGVRDEAIEGAAEAKRALGHQFNERDRIQNAFKRFADRFRQHQQRLEDVANVLLSAYRDAFKRSCEVGAPAHFRERYLLQRTELAPLHDTKVREADIESAEAALLQCIEEIGQKFDEAIRSFEPLEKLKAELERGEI